MNYREGVIVDPHARLSKEELDSIHRASMEVLMDPGVVLYHPGAAEIFDKAGAQVKKMEGNGHEAWSVKIPESLVKKALADAPQKVRLGARNPDNALELDGTVPRVYYGSGSETTFIVETHNDYYTKKSNPEVEVPFPSYTMRRGTVKDLAEAARLAEQFENLDFFLRPVNIQDKEITEENKDVNKFFASLDNTSKHIMAGLTDVNQIENVMKMVEIAAGGKEALRQNPIISFISCVTKSPLQLTQDATEKMLLANERGMPLVVSSSPQGGSTAPIDEAGMVTLINAEIICGIVLSQLAYPGSPVIYGSVPVRARMDNLQDMYGAPEFNHYNVSCAQMARYYKLPCYSTAGVADTKLPGIQASIEKMFTHLYVGLSGPHLIHYAFGLLDRTNIFSPEQAVLDNTHIGMAKMAFQQPDISAQKIQDNLEVIRKVMQSPYKLFARYARKQLHSGNLYLYYPFENELENNDGSMVEGTMQKVQEEKERLLALTPQKLPPEHRKRILAEIPGILEKLH